MTDVYKEQFDINDEHFEKGLITLDMDELDGLVITYQEIKDFAKERLALIYDIIDVKLEAMNQDEWVDDE